MLANARAKKPKHLAMRAGRYDRDRVVLDIEAFGIVRNTKNLKAARNLADWSVTLKANKIYNKEYAVVAMPGVAKPVKNFPKNIAKKMIKNDFAWAAANRMRILKKWQARYGAKSLPKKKK